MSQIGSIRVRNTQTNKQYLFPFSKKNGLLLVDSIATGDKTGIGKFFEMARDATRCQDYIMGCGQLFNRLRPLTVVGSYKGPAAP